MIEDGQRSVPEFDADAQAMLVAFRSEQALPRDVYDRVWHRVDASLKRVRIATVVRRAVVGLAIAATVSLVFVSRFGLLEHRSETRGAVQAPYRSASERSTGEIEASRTPPARPLPATNKASEDAAVLPSPPPPSPGPAELQRNVQDQPSARARRERTAPSPEPIETDSLAEETELLRQARRAVAAGDPHRALALLDTCARRFPNGVLIEERAALRVITLCEAGETSRGRDAARAFARTYPASALSTRVRDACESTHDG